MTEPGVQTRRLRYPTPSRGGARLPPAPPLRGADLSRLDTTPGSLAPRRGSVTRGYESKSSGPFYAGHTGSQSVSQQYCLDVRLSEARKSLFSDVFNTISRSSDMLLLTPIHAAHSRAAHPDITSHGSGGPFGAIRTIARLRDAKPSGSVVSDRPRGFGTALKRAGRRAEDTPTQPTWPGQPVSGFRRVHAVCPARTSSFCSAGCPG